MQNNSMSLLDHYREDNERSIKAIIELQKIETERITAECARIGAGARKTDRNCILIDDPLRVSPEEWHALCIRDVSFWLLVVVIPLLLAGILRHRLRWSWIWGLVAMVLSAYAGALGIGFISYFYFPLEYDSSGNLLRRDLVFATTIVASLVVFFIGLACNQYVVRFTNSIAKRGALQRIRLLICVVSLFVMLGAGLLALVDGSWKYYLAWSPSSFLTYRPWGSAVEVIFWSLGLLLAAIVLPSLYAPTIGRLFRWIRSGS
jgi:hypothetical protein